MDALLKKLIILAQHIDTQTNPNTKEKNIHIQNLH